MTAAATVTATDGWPAAVFDVPLLRAADAAARAAIAAAGRVRDVAAEIYQAGEPGEALFVVLGGAVELHATRRGDLAPSLLRTARPGDTFGEEALLAGLSRGATARAAGGARIAEIPAAVARRVLARVDDAGSAGGAREGRYLARAAAHDVLAGSALGRELAAAELELLLDGVALVRFARGAALVHAGDRATHVHVVAEGLVQLQRDGAVQAYLARGDFFGDEEAAAGAAHAATALAAGDTWCAVVPGAVLRAVADRNPGALARWRRVAAAQVVAQAVVVGDAAAAAVAAGAGTTQHAFKDLYRLQIARSLLVIDQDTCVRCGHCAWSCAEVHGESRLVRRGDKVVTPIDLARDGGRGGARPATLLLPNTCQHCRHAACLQDCPTGAIGRDLDGEVFIRADACTGCGNCARSCPWDNIAMAPRPAAPAAASPGALRLSAEVAVKCDLCRDFDAPACVTACPTGALLRIDPGRVFADVAHVLGAAPAAPATATAPDDAPPPPASATRALGRTAATTAALAATGVALVAAATLRRAHAWAPDRGVGLVAGVVAALVLVALAAYAVPKRLVRARMRPRDRRARARPPARSRTRVYLIAHVGLGLLAPTAIVAHAGRAAPASSGGALVLAAALAMVLGGAGALAYRALPRALTRLERSGALPEDLAGDAAELRACLFREISGTSALVKRLAATQLVPYARAPLGWLALAAAGHGLAVEERRVRARLDAVLAGRGGDQLAGLERVIRLAVELRALPGRRALTAALRGWLPAHVIAAAVTLALLVVHVVTAVRP